VSPTDGEHGTGAWLSIARDCVGPENASLMRNLLVELDAPREYCEAIEPLTGQVRRRARNVAIAETLTMFYGGIGATALARDWGRYANRTYSFDRASPSRLDDATPLRLALFRLTELNDGDSLSAKQVSRAREKRRFGGIVTVRP
jgi:hypothetical protein